MPGLASCVRGDRVCVFGFGRVLVRGRNDERRGQCMPTMRDAAAAARGPSERRAAAIPAGRGRTGVGRDTAIPLDKTELPRPSLDRETRGRPRGLADRGTRACRPIDRERREQDCVSEKQSERTWVLRLPARMARAGPAAPTAFAAVTRLAAAKPARRDRRRALIVDGARSEKCASTGLLTTPKHRCDRIIPKLPSG